MKVIRDVPAAAIDKESTVDFDKGRTPQTDEVIASGSDGLAWFQKRHDSD